MKKLKLSKTVFKDYFFAFRFFVDKLRILYLDNNLWKSSTTHDEINNNAAGNQVDHIAGQND